MQTPIGLAFLWNQGDWMVIPLKAVDLVQFQRLASIDKVAGPTLLGYLVTGTRLGSVWAEGRANSVVLNMKKA